MIVNRLDAHHLHNLIEPLRSGTFEESIGLTFLTDTVYDVTAVMELIDHLFDHSHIILQIRIDGNRHIGQIHRRDQSGGQCELMSHIACQLHAAYLYRMRLMFFFDQLPCTILTSIINKQNKTVFRNLPFADQIIQYPPQCFGSNLQHLFFVITRNYNSKFLHAATPTLSNYSSQL